MKTDIQQNCVKCGLCLSVCPVYQALPREQFSPRARIQLIKFYKNGQLKSSEGLKELISKCLMCGSCAAACPSGIDHYDQFMEMRTQMTADHGEPAAVKSLVFLLAREYRIRLAAGLGRLGQKLIPGALAKKYNIGRIPVLRLPEFNPRPFRRAVPEFNPTGTGRKGKVVYFTGCATNYLFDQTGFSTLAVLRDMGYETLIPRSQTCCAIPMLYHGAVSRAEKNVAANIAALYGEGLDDVDAVIVDCPTCGAALRNEYPRLAGQFKFHTAPGNNHQEKAAAIAEKTMDIMTFIRTRSDDADRNPKAPPVTVTYHKPCHLKNGLPEMDSTETLLQSLDRVRYVKAPDAETCCGGGGTFFQEYPDLSGLMVEKKVSHALATGADLWLTECPVCRINLSGNLNDADPIEVRHPVELFNQETSK